ncbi:hypothetical protein BK809_0001195 [Diplodia seriata]|uniref:Uncharacterized protein n=1 Tax=Diplodia seriata TaxID=420778 RepID=A0A1S8B6F4_9PEZI|nr:hypothetical protein BK809_0001195 [Diplodia seriata]
MSALLTRTAATRAARPLLPRTLPSSTAPRAPAVAIRKASTEADSKSRQARSLFSRFARLDPELYGILAVTAGAYGAFAYFFGTDAAPLVHAIVIASLSSPLSYRATQFQDKYRLIVICDLAGNPTGSTDARDVPAVPGSEPWRKEGATASGMYMYYPGGDVHRDPKAAPSALNTAVIPKVNLPKELHEKYNKWGKDGYDF